LIQINSIPCGAMAKTGKMIARDSQPFVDFHLTTDFRNTRRPEFGSHEKAITRLAPREEAGRLPPPFAEPAQ
jgi:hypothetical protein